MARNRFSPETDVRFSLGFNNGDHVLDAGGKTGMYRFRGSPILTRSLPPGPTVSRHF